MSRLTCNIFDSAARIFPVQRDPENGRRILRLRPENPPRDENNQTFPLHTPYHQLSCFMDGGRRMILRSGFGFRGAGKLPVQFILDLADGSCDTMFPPGVLISQVHDGLQRGALYDLREGGPRAMFWDFKTGRELGGISLPGWSYQWPIMLADGRGIVAPFYRGKYYDEYCESRFYHIDEQGDVKLIADAQGVFLNHLMPCPSDGNLFSYNRWPSPRKPTPVVIHIRDLSGDFDEPLKHLPETMLPGPIWGGQRDHYMWTPDGNRIVSYFSPIDSNSDDHFEFGWWLSAIDWRSGEDLAAAYPPERWGAHFTITPDSRLAVSCGGRQYQYLYAVDIEALRSGWNEQILCSIPHSEENGTNRSPFHMPHAAPDGSCIAFCAGWPGADDDTYLAEL